MKIVFLDVDGVLNSRQGWERDKPETWCYVTPECIDQLKHITEQVPDLYFVFSSTWRRSLPALKFQDLLAQLGVKVKFVGSTPVPPPHFRDLDGLHSDSPRGAEIQAWLDKHGKKVDRFVILDDDADMIHLMPHLVQTDFNFGLTAEKAEEVIRRLR